MSPHVILNDGNVVIADTSNASDSSGTVENQIQSSSVLHRSLHHQPLTVTGGQGSYLHLSDGRAILDATGGAAVACIGHGHPRIRAAVAEQMNTISYAHSLFYSTAASEELCRMLCTSTTLPARSGASTNGHTDGHGEGNGNGEERRDGEPQMTRAYIVSSGSEAMEAALKLARQYFLELPQPQPQRTRFIARRESYHGTTLGALGVGGHVGRREKFVPLLVGEGQVSHVSACNAYRGMHEGEMETEYGERLAEELDGEFQRVGGETVCAFIAEPVVGAALGCVPPVPGYFKAVERVCRKHGALLILDEVMSGMGRIGSLHAWQHPDIDVVPDIQTIGKALGGGYMPVAGVLVNKKVVDVLERGSGAFGHGQTYQGHPVACRAAAEVQKEIQEKNLVENVKTMGEILGRELTERLESCPYVGNVRGKGLFWGIEFVKDKSTKEPFDPGDAIAMGVHEKGEFAKFLQKILDS
ncbi:MAG: hypothetical protein M1821_009968 [Bathelium mastoideum]|nr:MAG: hypothetical protein M1821_009968 [Bathelium mastoideum]